MGLACGTAAAAAGWSAEPIADDLRTRALPSSAARAALATAGVFVFFEVLPHFPVGVSEVRFILGATPMLPLGAGPAAVGLAGGLLIQGLFFAPTDLPTYFVNVSTLLFPMFAIDARAHRWIPSDMPSVDLRHADVLGLSVAYQGGVVAWVAFWGLYGRGFGAENLAAIASFGVASMAVVLIEPLADLAALALAKAGRRLADAGLFTRRLHHPA